MRVLNSFVLKEASAFKAEQRPASRGGSLIFFFLLARGFLFVLLWEEQRSVPAIWFQPGCTRPPWLRVKSKTKDFHLKLPVCAHTNTHTRSRSTFKSRCWLRKVKVVFIRTCNQGFIHSEMPRLGFNLFTFYLWERETRYFCLIFCYTSNLMGLKIVLEKNPKKERATIWFQSLIILLA